MNLTIVFRNRQASERVKVRAEELAERLTRYFRGLEYVEWDVSRDGNESTVKCRAHSRSGYYRAQARAGSAAAALDLVFDKLVKERRRNKAKRIGGRRGASAKDR